jgi:hypothetical protein
MFFEEAAFVGIIGALTGLAAVLVGKVKELRAGRLSICAGTL